MTDALHKPAPKFFVLSICALRQGAAGLELAHCNGLILCAAADEARQKGLVGAQKRWSEADGWTGHDVEVREVSREMLADVIAQMSAAPSDEPSISSAIM